MRVVKRVLKIDSSRRPIRGYVKQIITDSEENIITDVQHKLELCQNCGKPILNEGDIQGSCAFCGVELCSVCAIRCSGCGALLCARHSISLPPENSPLCPRCSLLKISYDQAMLELRLLEQREIDFPGTLGLIAKLHRNGKLRKIERKLRRLTRDAELGSHMLVGPGTRPRAYPIEVKREVNDEGATQDEGGIRDRR